MREGGFSAVSSCLFIFVVEMHKFYTMPDRCYKVLYYAIKNLNEFSNKCALD